MFILHVHLLYGLSVLFRLYLHHSTPSSNFGKPSTRVIPPLSELCHAENNFLELNSFGDFFPSYTLMSRQPIHFFQAVHSLSWQKEVHFRCCIDGTETDRTLNLVFIFQNQIKVSLQFCFVSNAIICEQHVDQRSFVLLSKLLRNLLAPLNQWLESLRISHTATSCCILCFTLSREQSNHFAMGIWTQANNKLGLYYLLSPLFTWITGPRWNGDRKTAALIKIDGLIQTMGRQYIKSLC